MYQYLINTRMENEKEVQQVDLFRTWGAKTGTLSRRIIGASADLRHKYETSMQEGQIYLETSIILFLGDSGVGKTSLQRYFRGKDFVKSHNSTRGNEKHHVETAAVTESWEDVKEPENEQQYAASYATVQMTDYSVPQADDHGSSFDQHVKLVFGLLCICVAFAFSPIGLCSLKIMGCLFSTLWFSGNLPMGIRYGEGTALSIFYRYACIEILYAGTNMQHRIDNPDLLLEFQLGILCCGLVIGFVLGFGCRAGTSLVFSFVCLKSQGSILNFFSIISNMLYEWVHDFKHALTVFLIVSLTLFSWYAFHAKLYHEKRNIKEILIKVWSQVIVSNIAIALFFQIYTQEKYLNMYNHERVILAILTWTGATIGVLVCKYASPNLMLSRFHMGLPVYIIAIMACSYALYCLILWYMEKFVHHYMIIFLACFSGAMLEYTSMMLIGRSLAKVYDLPFYIRRALGFILGVGMVYFMNWKVAILPGEFILDQLLSVGIVAAFEMWGFWQVKQAMTTGIDLTKIRLAKAKHENGMPGMRKKFVLIDCGGQEEYHYLHHLFIPKDAVYIIVFNFEEAKGLHDSNELRMQFRKLRYWLNCVLVHICLPDDKNNKNDRPIFIVGTHRDSVDKEVRQTISQELTSYFEREGIDKYISWNGDTLVFEVENSVRCNRDEEGKHLRKQVAEVSKRQKTEIKFLKFSKIMPLLPPIITLSALKEAVMKENVVKDDNEFEHFLKYFNERGDIHCCDDDSGDCQTRSVVLRHGQSWFVELFLEILNMIKRDKKKNGILNESTVDEAIEHKINFLSECQSIKPQEKKHLKDICEKHLEENHLIVKVPGRPYYLVPFKLIDATQKDRDDLWKHLPEKEIVFGFDFDELEPKPIFWRLTSTLLKMSGDINFTEKKFRQTVYSDFAVFAEPSTDFKYKLEMKSVISQNVIKFTTRTDPKLPAGAIEQQTFEVFANLHKQLNHICNTSFPGQKYSVGLVCHLQDEHTCLWGEEGHVHMYHLGDNKSGFELFDNIAKGISAVCKCGAAPRMKIYLYSGKKPQETERQFEKLRENWTEIEQDLEPKPLLSYLFAKKVLDEDDMDVILNTLERKSRCHELRKRLRKCSPEKEPMRHLCTILREKQPHLADLLESSPETTDDRAVRTTDNI